VRSDGKEAERCLLTGSDFDEMELVAQQRVDVLGRHFVGRVFGERRLNDVAILLDGRSAHAQSQAFKPPVSVAAHLPLRRGGCSSASRAAWATYENLDSVKKTETEALMPPPSFSSDGCEAASAFLASCKANAAASSGSMVASSFSSVSTSIQSTVEAKYGAARQAADTTSRSSDFCEPDVRTSFRMGEPYGPPRL
jgi:hypothetical protein